MKRAVNLLRSSVAYRRDAFSHGLEVAGYQVTDHCPDPGPGDVLTIWNRYGGSAEMACNWEYRGATVLVVENGYLGKDWRDGNWYSISIGHHAGAGIWKPKGPERWDSWGVELKPWKTQGTQTLIFAQRGIGEPDVACPRDWADWVYNSLPNIARRIRAHPGKEKPVTALLDDLEGIKQCVTWNSAAGLIALMEGYPVWTGFPAWIGRPACGFLERLQKHAAAPFYDDNARLHMFRSLAWGMWDLPEIQQGLPFLHLLNP